MFSLQYVSISASRAGMAYCRGGGHKGDTAMEKRRPTWIERRPLTKRWFMALPSGYYVRTNTYPFLYVELTDDRERNWREFRTRNAGRQVYLFSNKEDCLESIAISEALRRESIARRGLNISPGRIFKAYLARLAEGSCHRQETSSRCLFR